MKKITHSALPGYSDDEKKMLLEYLEAFVSENKLSKFNELLPYRTRHLTIVLEDIFQPHNASAVLRSCDCFGIQDVHIIENRNKYEINPDVALGSSKWLSLFTYKGMENNTRSCLENLKSKRYRIIATTPHELDFTPATLPLEEKTALVFGTELEGLSPDALELADGYVKIPMQGFTESLNISVSAAILLHTLSNRLRAGSYAWQLAPEDQLEVRLSWVMSTVKNSAMLADDFLRRKGLR